MWRVALGLLVVPAGLAGCGKHLNPAWCAAHDDPDCPEPDARILIDPEPDSGAPPVSCENDDACPGTLCLPEGVCAAPASVLFVSPMGGGATCTSDAPCSLAAAIDRANADRDIVLLEAGIYAGAVAINHPVRLFGRGATLRAGPAGAAVTVTNNVIAELHDLSITGAVQGAGIACTSGNLSAFRVTVAGNQLGISSGCELRVERSLITGNLGGAISIGAGTIDIRNNLIVRNGNPMLAKSANVTISEAVTGVFAFNTVAHNDAKPNSIAGVECLTLGLFADGNLITENTNRGKFNVTQVSGCVSNFARSYIAPGTSNNEMRWVDPAALDYHLTAASTAALDAVDLDCADASDYDGESRPSGGRCDYGADELKRD